MRGEGRRGGGGGGGGGAIIMFLGWDLGDEAIALVEIYMTSYCIYIGKVINTN